MIAFGGIIGAGLFVASSTAIATVGPAVIITYAISGLLVFMIMRMLFGGHVDQYDYHVVGLNEEFLSMYLSASGFCNLKRVDFFGLFNDTSSLMFKGVPISLNMTAEKPRGAG